MTELNHLSPAQRRVIGVLIEKSLTTPQNYPLTLNSVVTACNQKSNRDPLVEWVEEEVDQFLEELKSMGLVTVVYPASGRSEKYRQEFTTRLELAGPEMAVVAELLLRGAQSLGDLRSRANRMKKIPTLGELEQGLENLKARAHPLVVRLTPEGVSRGVRVTHNLYTDREMEQVLAQEAEVPSRRAAAPRAVGGGKMDAIVAELAEVKTRLERIEQQLGLE